MSKTNRNQFQISIHKQWVNLHAEDLRHVRHLFIVNSAQDFPRALVAVQGLGSHPFLRFVIRTHYKLHVIHLGLITMFADLTNTVMQQNFPLSLPRLIAILNHRYSDLPPSANVPWLWLFKTKKEYCQAGISSKIRRQPAPLLMSIFDWCQPETFRWRTPTWMCTAVGCDEPVSM